MSNSLGRFVSVSFSLIYLAGLSACAPAVPSLNTPGPVESPKASEVPSPTPELSYYYGERPPAAKLNIGDQAQTAGVGTSTWIKEKTGEERTIVHADAFGLVTPADPLTVSIPFTSTLLLPVPFPPSTLWYRTALVSEEMLRETSGQETVTWHAAIEQPSVSLALENQQQIVLPQVAGKYLLEVYAEWTELGSVNYGFFLDVQESSGGVQTYTDPSGQFSLLLPAGWQPDVEQGVFIGPDGIFRSGFLPEMAFMDQVYRVCERLANTPQGPARMVVQSPGPGYDACTLLPYPEMSTSFIRMIVENPAGEPGQRYFYLETDPGHLESIVNSLHLLNPPSEHEEFPHPTGPLRPEDEVFWAQTGPKPVDLTVEEYQLVNAAIDNPTSIEFRDRIPEQVFQKRAAWRSISLDKKLASGNALLESFGYSLKAKDGAEMELYQLIRGNNLLLDDINEFWPVSLNASGSDFALVVGTLNSGYRLVQNGRLVDWDMTAGLFNPPVYYREELLSVYWDASRSQVQVKNADKTIFSFSSIFLTSSPVKGFWSWQGHWLLEVDGFLIQDGENLNERLGFEEIFGWQILDGKPFFYFRKGPRVGISDNGHVLPFYYDDIPHYRCCEAAAFNNAGNEDMVWFYGLRDGIWYYVELGVYG